MGVAVISRAFGQKITKLGAPSQGEFGELTAAWFSLTISELRVIIIFSVPERLYTHIIMLIYTWNTIVKMISPPQAPKNWCVWFVFRPAKLSRFSKNAVFVSFGGAKKISALPGRSLPPPPEKVPFSR